MRDEYTDGEAPQSVTSTRYTERRPPFPLAKRLPAWPEKILELASQVEGPRKDAARDELWHLLNLTLLQYLRFLGPRMGQKDGDRLHDIASEKAINLVGKFDRGNWRPQDSTAGELVSFVTTIARNALVDERRRSRPTELELNEGTMEPEDAPRLVETPVDTVERDRFVARLISCSGRLKPEHRVVWLFRILYDMPSRVIAAHPEVGLSPGNVDVILARARDEIRRCMGVDRFERHQLPPGTFAALWHQYRAASLPDCDDEAHFG